MQIRCAFKANQSETMTDTLYSTSSTSNSSPALLSECPEFLLQWNLSDWLQLVDELLSIFSSELQLCIYQEMLKTLNDVAKLASKRHQKYLMSARFMQGLIIVESCKGSRISVFFKLNVLETLWKDVLAVGNEEVFFSTVHSQWSVEMEVYFIL